MPVSNLELVITTSGNPITTSKNWRIIHDFGYGVFDSLFGTLP